MNWSRGFMRLWLAGSIVWAIVVVVITSADHQNGVRLAVEYNVTPPVFTLANWLTMSATIVAVPAIVLLFGLIVRWILRGFAR